MTETSQVEGIEVRRDEVRLELESPDGDLIVTAPEGHRVLTSFRGEQGRTADGRATLRCPKTHANAAALRAALPSLVPVPLGLATSAGFGDRLGNATPGHVRALERVGGDIAPIFAQQSIREMTRTGRSPEDVMTDATWGTFAAGWAGPVGADADHLKTTEDIDACVAAGFSFFTVDPGDLVDDTAEGASVDGLKQKVADLPWDALESSPEAFLQRNTGQALELETRKLEPSETDLLRALAKYGRSVAHTVRLYRYLESKGVPFELEVSVDETSYPTKAAEHVVVVRELKRLGVAFVSLAPRYVGSFEKGVDFIGDVDELRHDLELHAEIARALGPYKLSLHSGSDKFSVYPLIAEATAGLVHLKTAGTSYLEALRVVAEKAPDLFRDILTLSKARFEKDKKSYHLSCDPEKVPAEAELGDADLPELLNKTDTRQVLHVTFGSVLDDHKGALMAVLLEHEERYFEGLAEHFVNHLAPFAQKG